MKRKLIYATVAVVLSILLYCIVVKVYRVHAQVQASFAIWERFTGFIVNEELGRAQEMLSASAKEHYIPVKTYVNFMQDGVYYYDVNVTEKLTQSNCQYWPTFYFYMAEKKHYTYDKIVFDSGYALIDHDEIFFLKIP